MKLSEQARQLRNEYAREYRRKNPEKVRQYFYDFWERRAAQQAQEQSGNSETNL